MLDFLTVLACLVWIGVGALAFLWLAIQIGVLVKFHEVDPTDLSKDKRSGVCLVTDYGTGCQYLMSITGHLTPRLDSEGNQCVAAIPMQNTKPFRAEYV